MSKKVDWFLVFSLLVIVLTILYLCVLFYFKANFLWNNPRCLVVECRQIVELPK